MKMFMPGPLALAEQTSFSIGRQRRHGVCGSIVVHWWSVRGVQFVMQAGLARSQHLLKLMRTPRTGPGPVQGKT
jgi:hypothetical protein